MATYKRYVITAFDGGTPVFLTEDFNWTEEIGLAWMLDATKSNLGQVFRVYDQQRGELKEGFTHLNLKRITLETENIDRLDLMRLRKQKVLDGLSEDDRLSLKVEDEKPDEPSIGIGT